jgi:hypothetical protein
MGPPGGAAGFMLSEKREMKLSGLLGLRWLFEPE